MKASEQQRWLIDLERRLLAHLAKQQPQFRCVPGSRSDCPCSDACPNCGEGTFFHPRRCGYPGEPRFPLPSPCTKLNPCGRCDACADAAIAKKEAEEAAERQELEAAAKWRADLRKRLRAEIPKNIALLERIRDDPKTSPADRQRAIRALARAPKL